MSFEIEYPFIFTFFKIKTKNHKIKTADKTPKNQSKYPKISNPISPNIIVIIIWIPLQTKFRNTTFLACSFLKKSALAPYSPNPFGVKIEKTRADNTCLEDSKTETGFKILARFFHFKISKKRFRKARSKTRELAKNTFLPANKFLNSCQLSQSESESLL